MAALIRPKLVIVENTTNILSNHYPLPIKYDDVIWPTLEHAYQAGKCRDEKYRQRLLRNERPGAARLIGQSCPHRPENWNTMRWELMQELLQHKFSVSLNAVEALQATGDSWLLYQRGDDDTDFGVCYNQLLSSYDGINFVGEVLVCIRKGLS